MENNNIGNENKLDEVINLEKEREDKPQESYEEYCRRVNNPNSFNSNGYNPNGNSQNGFNPNGYNPNNNNPNGNSQNGFNSNGYNPNNNNPNGYNPNGYNPNGYNPNGYNPNGYNPNGYNPNGYNPNGYNQNSNNEPNNFRRLTNEEYLEMQRKDEESKKKLELNLGKYIIPIMAAILIFIGLGSLGKVLIEYLTDPLKITLMFVISLLITIVGGFLRNKKDSAFSNTVLSCGIGSVFISLLVTFFHFEAITEIPFMLLLLAWVFVVFGIYKQVKSSLYLIISHIGLSIAVLLGINSVLGDKLIIAGILLIVESVFAYLTIKEGKNLTPIINKILTVIVGVTNFILLIQMENNFVGISKAQFDILGYIVLVISGLMFYFISYNLLASKDAKYNKIEKGILTTVLFFLNMTVMIILGDVIKDIYRNEIEILEITTDILVIIANIYNIYLLEKLKIKQELKVFGEILFYLNMLSIVVNCISASVVLEEIIDIIGFYFIVIPTLIYGIKKKSDGFVNTAIVFTFLSAMNSWMALDELEGVYKYLNVLISNIGSIAVMYEYYIYKESKYSKKMVYNVFVLFTWLFGINTLAIVSGLFNLNFAEESGLFLIIFTLYEYIINMLAVKDLEKTDIRIVKVTNVLLILDYIFGLVFYLDITDAFIKYPLLAVLGVLCVTNALRVFNDEKSEQSKDIWTLVSITVYIHTLLYSIIAGRHLGILYSILYLTMAVVCIIMGFKKNHRSYRLFGLILSIGAVLKIIFIDAAISGPGAMAIECLTGGVLLLGIVYIYDKMEKKLKVINNKEISLDNQYNENVGNIEEKNEEIIRLDKEEKISLDKEEVIRLDKGDGEN